MQPEQEGSTFTDLIYELLGAIQERDVDEEMVLRAELRSEFKLSPEQVNSALFKALGQSKLQKTKCIDESVDLSKVKPTCYLMDGWLLEGDVALLYGSFGTGKTTLALYIAYNFAKGINVLDRSKPCKPGKSLFIATDGGANTFKKAMDDLGIADDDPIFCGPTKKIYLWAFDAEQGQEAWAANINGVIKLEQFVESKGLDLVWIDSAKSVASRGGWSYIDNDSVRVLLSYMREIIAQPNQCHIGFLSHDGTEKGSHSGAKSWAEEPSMVIHLTQAKVDGRQVGVEAKFKKDRAAHVDPRRIVRFNLEDGEMVLLEGCKVVGNCEEQLKEILWKSYRLGTKTLSRKELANKACKYGSTSKTVDNTLGPMVTKRVLVRPHRGQYALAPATIQRLESLPSKGGNIERSIDMTVINELPDHIPEGNDVFPAGEVSGNHQIPLLPIDLK